MHTTRELSSARRRPPSDQGPEGSAGTKPNRSGSRVAHVPEDERDGVRRIYSKLAAHGNCTVLVELHEEVTTLPKLLDGLEETGKSGVVGVAPGDLVAVREDGL